MTTWAQTEGGGPWHLFEVNLDGRVLRYTDRPGGATVTTRLDGAAVFTGGLTAEPVPRALGEAPEVGVDILGTVAEIAQAGAELDGAPATVWRWYEGTSLADARVVVVGELSGAYYGGPTESWGGTVRAITYGAGVVPSPAEVVNASTWPVRAGYAVDPEAVGAVYPTIVGRPGALGASGLDAASSPAYLVELATAPANLLLSRVLIAGHRVAATSVTLHDVSGKTSAVRTVATMIDATGRLVSYVDFQGLGGASDPYPEEGREYRVAWDQGGGGVVDEQTGAEVRGGGSLIGWLLRRYAPTFRLDSGRQDAQRGALDRYLFDFAIVEPVDVVGLVTDAIAQWLPVRLVAGPGGYAWEHRPPRARLETATAHLDASPRAECARLGPVRWESSEVVSRVTIDYGVSGAQQRPARRVVLDKTTAYLASVASQRHPDRDATATIPHVCDDATAARIAADVLEARGYRRRVLTLTAPIARDALEAGEAVTVTASDIGLSAAPAWVESVTATGSRTVEIELVLDDHPTTRRLG